MSDIELGFVSATDENRFQFHTNDWKEWDGGKIGGEPNWLSSIDSSLQLQCSHCHASLSFLMQIYCPLDTEVDAFHRVLYVFLCTSSSSLCHGTFRVLRMQLPRKNPIYSFESDVETLPKRPSVHVAIQTQQTLTFPHFDIFVEMEPNFENATPNEKKLLENYKHDAAMASDTDPFTNNSEIDISQSEIDQLLGITQSHDKRYLSFLSKIAVAKSQILRYSRWNNENILWVHSKDTDPNVNKCERCGSERKFEFQILPQLLYYLHVDDDMNIANGILKAKQWEWATLVIYTCVKSCVFTGDFAEEFIYRQPPLQEETKDT